MAYRTFIAATINGNKCYFDLDTCTERSLTSNVTIPQYPVESGVTISDHMYRNPRTLSLSGTFSLNRTSTLDCYTLTNITKGITDQSSWSEFFTGEGEDLKQLPAGSDYSATDRMTAVQTLFEWIQAKGVLCDIYMSDRSSTVEKTRFKSRHNMALQNISWRENYNSMSYMFTFTEIISISPISSFETYSYNDLYPNVYLPASRSLGEVLMDTGGLIDLVLQTLVERGYISKADCKAFVLNGDVTKGGELQSFMQAALNIFSTIVYSAAEGAITGARDGLIVGLATVGVAHYFGAFSAGNLALLGASSALPVIGWIIVGTVIAGMIAGAIYNTVTKAQAQAEAEAKLARGFNLIKNYRQFVDPETLLPTADAQSDTAILNKPDFARLRVLVEDMAAGLNEVFQDLTFYQLSSSDAELPDCEMPLQVGNDILTVKISQNKTESPNTDENKKTSPVNPYSLNFIRGTGSSAKNVPSLFGSWPVCKTLYEMKSNATMAYKDTSRQYQVYLLNPYLGVTEGDEYEAAFRNASYYYLVVYRGNIEDATKQISEQVNKILTNGGYTP